MNARADVFAVGNHSEVPSRIHFEVYVRDLEFVVFRFLRFFTKLVKNPFLIDFLPKGSNAVNVRSGGDAELGAQATFKGQYQKRAIGMWKENLWIHWLISQSGKIEGHSSMFSWNGIVEVFE